MRKVGAGHAVGLRPGDAVTGSGTLNGEAMPWLVLADGRSQYMMFRGEMSGLIVTVPPNEPEGAMMVSTVFLENMPRVYTSTASETS